MKFSDFNARPLALVAALLCSGCAIVSSVPGGHGAEGIGYMLPRALLPVELVYDGTSFELRIKDAVLVGDPAHTYALQRSGNIFTSDNVVVSVDPVTGLLSAVNVKSEDKSADAITKLASGMKAESGDAVKSVVVFRDLFDPGWEQAEVTRFNRDLQAAAQVHLRRVATEQNCAEEKTTAACKATQALASELSSGAFAVSVQGAAGKAVAPANCGAGFCYRINVPHVVRLQGPGTSNSAVFGLPNLSPTFVMPLERWAFVKTTHDVKLKGGVFESVTTDRPSSAFAVASVPFDIAKGAVTSASELVQVKLDFSGKQKAFYDAQVKEIEAKAARDKALLDKAPPKAEAALWGLGADRETPHLSIRVGKPSQLDAAAGFVVGAGKAESGAASKKNPEPAKTPGATGLSSSGSAGNSGAEKK